MQEALVEGIEVDFAIAAITKLLKMITLSSNTLSSW